MPDIITNPNAAPFLPRSMPHRMHGGQKPDRARRLTLTRYRVPCGA